mmetsp:Transcript_167809/g.538927  ORF Transcript_167809/g.538927 Transcript_167809/m.538927 type:complete len:132 (+) Transcript_167809:73-468(+)
MAQVSASLQLVVGTSSVPTKRPRFGIGLEITDAEFSSVNTPAALPLFCGPRCQWCGAVAGAIAQSIGSLEFEACGHCFRAACLAAGLYEGRRWVRAWFLGQRLSCPVCTALLFARDELALQGGIAVETSSR